MPKIIANWNNIEENRGGQESFFKMLAEILKAKRVSYTLAENVIKYGLFIDGFHIIYRGFIIDSYLEWYEKLFPLDLIIKNSAIGGFIKLKTPQITLFQDPYFSILKFMLNKGIFTSNPEHYPACIELMRRTAKNSTNVAVSNFMKEEMRLCDIRCDKVIEEGIDTDFFIPLDKDEFKKMHNLPFDKKIGIAITKFSPTKGWDILVKLINKFQNIHWIVVLTEKLEKKSEPKLKNVTLIEEVIPELMPRFYNCADFFINVSPVESFGLSALEAASCNLPLIIYKTGFVWDWWDMKLGIRVDNWTEKDFENAVQEMYNVLNKKSEKMDNIYTPRKAIIKRGFTKVRMAKEWQDFVENLLKNR